MKTIYFITGNKNKFDEVRAIIGQEVEQLDVDLVEIQEIDSQKIIEAKIKEAFAHKKAEFIVEDTAFHLHALNGLPGPFVKWFLKALGPQKLYEIARDQGSLRAKVVTMVGYAKSNEEINFFEGVVEGEIVEYREGEGFGFDFIFKPDGSDKTYSEMTKEQKNLISMRRIALNKLKVFLDE